MEKLKVNKNNLNLLKVNYAKALEDDTFKTLVDSLELTSEKKMKYTTRLQEASLEINNCSNCSSLLSCKNSVKGFCLTPKVINNSINFSYQKCSYQEENEKVNKYLNNIYYYEVPTVLKTASFKNIYKDDAKRLEIIKKIKAFYDNYKKGNSVKGIYLNGNFGSGKSYLIGALFNELAKLDYQSAIIYFPEFLRSLKASFNSSIEYQERFEYIKKVPLLLIDDIGAEKLTDWARDEILGSILQYRMDFNLPTFFTSNLTINELENHLQITNGVTDKVKARRIIERIKYLTDEITLISINRRSE